MKYISFAVLFTFFNSTVTVAQSDNDARRAYFLSGGLYFSGVFDGPNQLNASGYCQQRSQLFSAQVNIGNGRNTNDNGYYEYSLLYGRVFNSDWLVCSASGGLTYYLGDWEHGDDVDRYTGIGPSIEGIIMVAPIRWVGIGLKMSKTFRKHSSEVSPMLTIQIGKVR